MAITRVDPPFDATWSRAWEVDDSAELDTLCAIVAPLGPKRGDYVKVLDPDGLWYVFVSETGFLPIRISGFAELPINLTTDVEDRLPYANMVEVNGPALIGSSGPGVGNANQFQPNNSGDVLQYDGTNLVFSPITDNALFYAAGPWTPTIGGTGGQSGQAYNIQDGYAIKIGDLVTAFFRVRLTTLGTITGAVLIDGLPYTSFNNANAPNTAAIFWAGLTTPYQIIQGNVLGNSTQIILIGLTAPSTTIIATLAQADLSATTEFRATVTYRAAP